MQLKRDEVLSFKPDFENLDSENVTHQLIIGENLHALELLLKTRRGKIDVIYIDPPYNTESTEFNYHDKLTRASWLEMMSARLKLAQKLLSEQGAIFISIDDNEQAYLKILCDEIFDEKNFVANVTWHSTSSVLKQSKFVRKEHEYILIYAKNLQNLKFNKLANSMKFQNLDNDPKGEWFSSNAAAPNQKSNKNRFAIKLPNGQDCTRSWKFSLEDYESGAVSLYFKGANVPRLKIYKSEYGAHTATPSSIFKDLGSITSAKKQLREIFGLDSEIFATPKPTSLILHILKIASRLDSVILDFFAGSGSTAHAVMELNEQDGGKRQCILVTNNENNIARGVAYERIFRICKGVGTNGENFVWAQKNKTFAKCGWEVLSIQEKDSSQNV